MKKYTTIFLTIVMVLSLAACGSGGNGSAPTESQPPASTQESASTPTTAGSENSTITPPASNESQGAGDAEASSSGSDDNPEASPSEGSNILVAYFSRSGNTVWADGVDAVTSASINLIDGGATASYYYGPLKPQA